MSGDKWKDVQNAFHGALDRSPAERNAFLEDVCSGDLEMRAQVESLLRAYDVEDDDFLEKPAFQIRDLDEELQQKPSEPAPGEHTDLAGLTIGPYRIHHLLGAGGMGEVYRGTDLRLERDVAIKILPQSLVSNPSLLRRFEQEARAVSALNHTNICHLYDIGEFRGRPYFTMELLEGQTLRERIGGKPMPLADFLQFGVQIAEALEAAHSKGIVHRDIKPGNVFITSRGLLKVMDFGLAKRALNSIQEATEHSDDPHTEPGIALGTVFYMSPEQARAEELDTRTDLFSFGVVLYEMVTGVRPFRGNTTAVVFDAILNETPLLASRLNSSVPLELDRIIQAALEKDRTIRSQSAAEIRAALLRVQRDFSSGRRASAASDSVPAPATPDSSSTEAIQGRESDLQTVAVLPFQLLRGEDAGDEYLGLGLADALITRLSAVRRLVVRPTSSVTKYAGNDRDLIQVGRELGVSYGIDGLIRRSGNRVRVTVQLVRIRDAKQIWAAQFDEKFTDVINLEDSISNLAVKALVPRLSVDEWEALNRRDTESPDAYGAYLKGRYQLSTYSVSGMAEALVAFMDAIAKDPGYARAYAGIADYHNWAGAWNVLPAQESFAAAFQASETAVRLNDAIPETQASFGYSLWNHLWDWESAERAYRRAISLNPSYAPAHRYLAYLMSARGFHADAIEQVQCALRLDPFSPVMGASAALIHYYAGRFDVALEVSERTVQIDSEGSVGWISRAWTLSRKGDHPSALEAAHQAVTRSERAAPALSTLATVLASAGQTAQARTVLEELERREGPGQALFYDLALAYAALGEAEKALSNLDKSIEGREWWVRFLNVEPRFEALRTSPKWRGLTKRLGIAEATTEIPIAAAQLGRSATRRNFLAAAGAAVACGAGYGAYRFFKAGNGGPLFRSPGFTKITTSGNATIAAISPDRNYVAFVLDEGGRHSLWVRQVSIASAVRIVEPSELQYRGLRFSQDGSYIYFVTYQTNRITQGALYRIPVLGGVARKVVDQVSGGISLSPDHQKLAFIRSNVAAARDELIVGDVEGKRQKAVAIRKHPRHFAYSSSPAWSPDSRHLACASENTDANGFYVHLVGFRLRDGAERSLSNRRWQYVEQIAWLSGDRGLLTVGRDAEASFQQIWQMFPDGNAVRLTNDLSDYYGISLDVEAKALVTAQAQTLSNVWSVNAINKGEIGEAKRVTPGYGRYFDLCWLNTRKILYASDASGNADIWSMDADGTSQRQLTANAHRNYSPAGSPDGRSVAFHSNRTGTWNIWQMDADGSNVRQLTDDANDSNWPVWTPDSKYVVYHHIGPKGYQSIFRVPAEGGTPAPLTDHFTLRPAVSPKDGALACWYTERAENPQWRIAILPPEGGAPLKQFEFPSTTSVDSTLRWTHDGTGITYVDHRDGVSNIWIQPVDGSAPRPATTLKSDQIFSMDWSSDGRLIYSRGLRTSDIVLITDRA